MPHLPWAEHEDDEFCHPSHGWYLLSRCIIYDGWLSWRHAIPDSRKARHQMPLDVSISIALLAQAVDDVHRTVPGYSELDDTPFEVFRWWDPEADDEWQTGCCVLFRYGSSSLPSEDSPAMVFQSAWDAKFGHDGPATLTAVTERHLEATLIRTPVTLHPWIGSGSPPPVNRQSSGNRRKPRTPPPRTGETGNDALASEQR